MQRPGSTFTLKISQGNKKKKDKSGIQAQGYLPDKVRQRGGSPARELFRHGLSLKQQNLSKETLNNPKSQDGKARPHIKSLDPRSRDYRELNCMEMTTQPTSLSFLIL